MPDGAPWALAPLGRRLLALVYDTLLLAAVLWSAALPFQLVESATGVTHDRLVFQAYLILVSGVYFVWQWVRGGQTLGMRTWHLRLLDVGGRPLSVRTAIVRYGIALAGTGLCGLGFLWAVVDRERQFLHDRIARTRIVRIAPR